MNNFWRFLDEWFGAIALIILALIIALLLVYPTESGSVVGHLIRIDTPAEHK